MRIGALITSYQFSIEKPVFSDDKEGIVVKFLRDKIHDWKKGAEKKDSFLTAQKNKKMLYDINLKADAPVYQIKIKLLDDLITSIDKELKNRNREKSLENVIIEWKNNFKNQANPYREKSNTGELYQRPYDILSIKTLGLGKTDTQTIIDEALTMITKNKKNHPKPK